MKEAKLIWMILVLGMGLTLSACGDDDDEGDEVEPQDTSSGAEDKNDTSGDTGSTDDNTGDTGTGEAADTLLPPGSDCGQGMGVCAAAATDCTAGSTEDLVASMTALTENVDMGDMGDIGGMGDLTGNLPGADLQADECAGVCCLKEDSCEQMITGAQEMIDGMMEQFGPVLDSLNLFDGGLEIGISGGCSATACEGGAAEQTPWGCPSKQYCCMDFQVPDIASIFGNLGGGADGGAGGFADLIDNFFGGGGAK